MQGSLGVEKIDSGEIHMLFIVGTIIVLALAVIIPRVRVPGGVNADHLGWMSERWLGEHRTSRSA